MKKYYLYLILLIVPAALHAMDNNNKKINSCLKAIAEERSFLSMEQAQKLDEIMGALEYSNYALMSPDEFEQFKEKLNLVHTPGEYEEFLRCLYPYVDEDDNLSLSIDKSHYFFRRIESLNAYFEKKSLFVPMLLLICEVGLFHELQLAWKLGKDGDEIIARMLKTALAIKMIFFPSTEWEPVLAPGILLSSAASLDRLKILSGAFNNLYGFIARCAGYGD